MADGKRSRTEQSPTTSTPSLSRALAQSGLRQLDQSDVFPSQTSVPLESRPSDERRVLIIYTGGTIGMKDTGGGLKPVPNALFEYLHDQPIFYDEKYAKDSHLYDDYNPKTTLVLPLSKQKKRIVYTLLEYNPLLDSSNMTPDDWAKIGKDIKKHYEQYVGIVVLHGTDTMAYTASALSFMCEHLAKPIIVTGAQLPIYQLMNDGRDNLLEALLIAGQFPIPEVCLYFNHELFRGNRVTKVDAESFNAYSSPNFPPLAVVEVDIKINWDIVWKPKTKETFEIQPKMSRNIGLLRLFPGITAETVKAFLQKPMEGVVLETYGAGNAPDNDKHLLKALKDATDRGVIIVNCTQCLRGSVTPSYATGEALEQAGVIPGCDMTPEAALTKLSHVVAMDKLSIETKKKMMRLNLRGELTPCSKEDKLSLRDSSFIQVIAKSLNIGCKEELEAVREALTPTLACAAAKTGDLEALEVIREMSSDLSVGDYEGRTPLHIATCEGYLNVVQYLLSHGASVNARDRYGNTPLRQAIHCRNRDIVTLLRQTGACLSQDELQDVGSELCSLAANGDLEGLKIWQLAGAELGTSGKDGQTAMGIAQATGKKEMMEFLQVAGTTRKCESTANTRLVGQALKQLSRGAKECAFPNHGFFLLTKPASDHKADREILLFSWVHVGDDGDDYVHMLGFNPLPGRNEPIELVCVETSKRKDDPIVPICGK